MRLYDSFESLNEIREQMGAELRQNERLPLPDSQGFGTPVRLDEIQTGRRGLLCDESGPFLAHIQDTWDSRESLIRTPQDSKKVHMLDCKALKQMRAAGKIERYVSTRRSDGWFLVHFRERTGGHGEIEAQLAPCGYCLAELGLKGRSENFDFAEYLQRAEPWSFTEGRMTMDTDRRPSDYTSDWKRVSRQTRDDAGWLCIDCGVELMNHARLLHTHHRNGVRSDNRRANLEVVCVDCHSRKPMHSHMRANDRDLETIARERKRQGLDSHPSRSRP